jgi:hypothetical protein
MCHYYESTEEWQALWVKRAEERADAEAELDEREPAVSPADD